MIDFDQFKIGRVYDRARSLPPETWKMWKRLILRYAPKAQVKTVLDLGCGTGRFSTLLQKAYGAKVIGVDPGPNMLSEARKIRNRQIKFVMGSAEKIPLAKASVDLVFMSMMYHLVRDKKKMLMEVARVLRPGGYVVVRQALKETNNREIMFRFFPESRRVAMRLVGPRAELRRTFRKAFKLIGERHVRQKAARSYKAYYARVAYGASSIFRLIPRAVFEKRLAEFKKHCFASVRRGPAYEYRDLFVFRKK